ncbi:MAG: threonine synthase [Syntrophomonadaceae bacterium]
MMYSSSRGQAGSVSAAEAIKMGIAPDGGLFVPDYVPRIDAATLTSLGGMNYQARARQILGLYLRDFEAAEIARCVDAAYNTGSFDDARIAPLVPLDAGVFVQELWHGPTCAFKDMALQILPHLMTTSAAKTGETDEIVILVATSGDTGKAALEGFKDVDGIRIVVFYPVDGVSQVQKRQMVTQTGKNVTVAAVEGNFDDAQNGVKQIFADPAFIGKLAAHGMKMSSANSINWGRLVPQVVYYVSAYADLLTGGHIGAGEEVNVVVPTGNFGNILAAYYASRMGVPIKRLICASNINYVLTDFINSGIYDRRRDFARTISPSMDILISSNLERLLFEVTGHDAGKVKAWMQDLQAQGYYEVDREVKAQVQAAFWAGYASDDETRATIRSVWENNGYLLDTHTAVGVDVYRKYVRSSGDQAVTIIVSTASPYKFSQSVAEAIMGSERLQGMDEFAIAQALAEYTGKPIPAALRDIEKRPILHRTVCPKQEMGQVVLDYLKIG